MNFNLVSPTNNGSEFTIQFKEHITISQNSSVKLNFAELVRDKEVILLEDAEITMSIDPSDMVPTAPPADSTAQNLAFDTQTSSSKKVNIPKGDYTFVQFRDEVEKVLVTLLAASNLKTYEVFVDNNENEAVLTIGVMPETTDTQPLEDFTFDVTHEHDGTQGPGGNIAYTTTNVAGAYDNYAISAKHYYHYIDNASLGVKNTEEENLDITTQNNAYCYAKSAKTITAQDGNLWLGLYSKEYADGIAPAPARTNGNNPPVLDSNGLPKCFMACELTGTGQGIIVYYAKDTAGVSITQWTDLNREIGDMEVVGRIPITNFDTTDDWEILIGTEIDNSKDRPKIRIKVAGYQGATFAPLWDSNPINKNLPFELMVGDTTVYDNATALNSQIPFNWFTSVKTTALDNGFQEIQYKEFTKTIGSDANPVSLAKKISLTFSSNAARAIGVKDTLVIRPNQYTPANPNAVVADLDFTWKKNNYSILLDLPINNFKNKSASANTRDNAGVKKQVLANIPAAFATGETIESIQPNIGNSEVITVYQPYNVIESKLKNNTLQINSMNFQIVDMLTEQKATEIKRAVINFTIDGGEEQESQLGMEHMLGDC
jgi:hypothetical protein